MSAVKDTVDPAATETVSVPDPLAPPTLHLRSLEAKSRKVSTSLRWVFLEEIYRSQGSYS